MTKTEIKNTIRGIHALWYEAKWTRSPTDAMRLHRLMEKLFNFAEIESTLVKNNPDKMSPAEFKKTYGVDQCE